ncbi:uncharacterized protein LOC119076685 isoform X2 [Bradysia coprophila]|uniref:uncharacterized protein LOC119076685 isoform X2 n=1 Tax=Bradysia coprophila TaxID=38358 RepID=UPI00187DC490|nr:uncharacterized protein LOC119076685 isoform X2 [Bradysia coprophila]
MDNKHNKQQELLLQENMFAAEVTGFSKIGDATRVTILIQFNGTSFELSETLVNDGSIFERRKGASFERQFNPNNGNGTEHSVNFANIQLKSVTSTPKIANSIDLNNNKNGQSSEKERSKCGEIITTHQFYKVTCSCCEHTHWCPRTHQPMDLLYQTVERSTGTARTPSHPKIRQKSSNMFTSTSDIAPLNSEQMTSQPLKTSANEISIDEISIDEICNTGIGRIFDIGIGDKITKTSQDNSLTSKNGDPDDTDDATKQRGGGCNGTCVYVHLPSNGKNMFTSTSAIAPSPTKSYDTPDSRKRNTNDFANSQRKRVRRFQSDLSKKVAKEMTPQPLMTLRKEKWNTRISNIGVPSSDPSTDKANETNNPSIHERTVIKANERNGKKPQIRFGADRQSGPLADISNVIQDKKESNLSKTQTGKKSAIDPIIQPKKALTKINKRKKKPVTEKRRSSRNRCNKAKNIWN